MKPKFIKEDTNQKLYEFPVKDEGYSYCYQRAPYIEDGWYLMLKTNGKIEVWDTPEYGGEPSLIKEYNSLNEAWENAPKICT